MSDAKDKKTIHKQVHQIEPEIIEVETIDESVDAESTGAETEETEAEAMSLKKLMTDLESLLKSSDEGTKLHAQLTDYIGQLKPLINNPENSLTDKTKELFKKANDYVQKNPLASVGIAAGASILLTLLANRKK